MSLNLRTVVLCFGFSVSLLQTVAAETVLIERSTEVTLTSLVQAIFEHHPARQAELIHQQQINANTNLANATFSDSKTASVNHYNDVVGSSDGFQEWEGGIDMPLWLPGQKQQQLTLSEKLSTQLPTYQQQLRLEISAEVRKLVWDIALTEVGSQQAYQVWQAAQKLEQNVNSRISAGELAGTDGLVAKAYSLEMHSQYMSQQSELKHALKTYQHITGMNNPPKDYEESLADRNTIESDHPLLVALDSKINTLQSKQEIARYDNTTNPSLSVGIRRERGDSSESFNHSVGLGFNFALNNEVYSQPAIVEASMVLADAQIVRQKIAHKLNTDLSTLQHELATKQQQLRLIVDHNETTQHYVAVQQHAFDLGEIDLLSLLNSKKLANDSINRKQLLEIDVKHITAKINQALGLIL